MARLIVEGPDNYLPKIVKLLRGFKKVTVTEEGSESSESDKKGKKKK